MKKRELLLGLLIVLISWQIGAWLLDNQFLPGPFIVAQTFFSELTTGKLIGHFLVSLWRVLASVLLAIALAAPAGLALGQNKRIDRLFAPIIYVLYPIPKIVFLPILLLLFGIGDTSKIFIIFLILFFKF